MHMCAGPRSNGLTEHKAHSASNLLQPHHLFALQSCRETHLPGQIYDPPRFTLQVLDTLSQVSGLQCSKAEVFLRHENAVH